MTAPWPAEVAGLVAGPHQTTCRVVAHLSPDVDLPVTDLRIGWDEGTAPRCTATVTCPLPEESLLDALDPRLIVRVSVVVGYRLLDGSLDERTVATLDLRAVEEVLPDGVLVLDLAGVERRIIDMYLPLLYSSPGPVSVLDVLRTVVNGSFYYPLPQSEPLVVDPAVVDQLDTFEVEYSAERWRQAEGLADTLGADLYDPGDGSMRCVPRPVAASRSVHQLRTGPGGTLTRTRSRRSRESWHNWTHLRFDTGTGDPGTWRYANAEGGGDYDIDHAGMVIYAETRNGKPTQATANAIAETVLRRQLTGGRSYSCEAIAAWWVRPGDTVTVETRRDPQERHLVSRVDLSWPANTMTLTTRTPEA